MRFCIYYIHWIFWTFLQNIQNSSILGEKGRRTAVRLTLDPPLMYHAPARDFDTGSRQQELGEKCHMVVHYRNPKLVNAK